MTKSNDEFEHKSLQDSESIVAHFQNLAQGFQSGRLLFCSGKQELVLKPHGLLKFGIKARREDGTTKVSIKISWRESAEKDSTGEPLQIHVPSSEES